MVLGEPGIGDGGRNSLRQRTTPSADRARILNIRVTGARPFSVNRSGRKSVKIRKNSYGWQLCGLNILQLTGVNACGCGPERRNSG